MILYALPRKVFKQECEFLNCYLKTQFCEVKHQQWKDYLHTEKLQLPPLHTLLRAHRHWIMDEILLPTEVENRARSLKLILKMAQFFYEEGNLSAYCNTLQALEEKAIKRLNKSWYQVPHKYAHWFLVHVKKNMEMETADYFKNTQHCLPYLPATRKCYLQATADEQMKMEEWLLRMQQALSIQKTPVADTKNSRFICRLVLWQSQAHYNEETLFLERSLLLE